MHKMTIFHSIKFSRIKKILTLELLFIISLVSCYYEHPELEVQKKQRLINSVIKKSANKIKNEKALIPFGRGGCAMNNIQMLALSFIYRDLLTIEKARELVIYAAQKLTDEINSENDIHPYLYKYPFLTTDTEIRIFVQNSDYPIIPPEYICVVSLTDGIVKYDIDDPQTTLLRTIYRETYEEALAQLSLQHTSSNAKTEETLTTINWTPHNEKENFHPHHFNLQSYTYQHPS